MKKCVYCGAPLDDDALFCANCGKKIEAQGKRCQQCGAEVEADSLFCARCGFRLDGQPSDIPTFEEETEEKDKTWIYVIGGLLAAALLIFGGYFVYRTYFNDSKDESTLTISEEEEEFFIDRVHSWDEMHNRKGFDDSENCPYAGSVKFYGKTMSGLEAAETKQKLLLASPDYRQESTNIKVTKISEKRVRCDFEKHTSSRGKSKVHPACYLVLIDEYGGIWRIEEESDSVTDANLSKLTSSIKYEIRNKNDYMELVAVMNGSKQIIDVGADWISIIDQRDYDGDNLPEALVGISSMGSASVEPMIVYYDNETKQFKTTRFSRQQLKVGIGDNSVQKWKGKWSFYGGDKYHWERYVFERGHVSMVEDYTMPSARYSKSILSLTPSRLFGSHADVDDTKEVSFDLDCDGMDEIIECTYKSQHWGIRGDLDFAPAMEVSILWAGSAADIEELGLAFQLNVLESLTDGVHDITTDKRYDIFKWNGSTYSYYEWNGSKFERKRIDDENKAGQIRYM